MLIIMRQRQAHLVPKPTVTVYFSVFLKHGFSGNYSLIQMGDTVETQHIL